MKQTKHELFPGEDLNKKVTPEIKKWYEENIFPGKQDTKKEEKKENEEK